MRCDAHYTATVLLCRDSFLCGGAVLIAFWPWAFQSHCSDMSMSGLSLPRLDALARWGKIIAWLMPGSGFQLVMASSEMRILKLHSLELYVFEYLPYSAINTLILIYFILLYFKVTYFKWLTLEVFEVNIGKFWHHLIQQWQVLLNWFSIYIYEATNA